MEKIHKNRISYLLYLCVLFLLGRLVGDHVNINGTQEVLNNLINLDITNIFFIIVAIEVLFIILTVVIGIIKNLDAKKGLIFISSTMSCIVIEIGMFSIYRLIEELIK